MFATLVKFTSILIILVMIAFFDLHLHQIDVVTVFLYGKLQEKVFIKKMEEFICDGKRNLVCHLTYALYGLKQTLCKYAKLIDSYLSDHLEMTQNSADACVSLKREKEQVVIV